MSNNLIFTVAFSDKIGGDWAVIDPQEQLAEGHYVYNIKRMDPGVEKWSASWEVDMTNPIAHQVIHNWETTIRVPHLKMSGCHVRDSALAEGYKQSNHTLEFIPLIPVSELNTAEFDYHTDTEHCVMTTSWGALYLSVQTQLDANQNGTQMQLSEYLFSPDDNLPMPDVIGMPIVPKFHFDFELGASRAQPGLRLQDPEKIADPTAKANYKRDRDRLHELGFTDNSILNQIQNTMIPIGELVTEPLDVINNIKDAPFVSRISLTKPEE